MRHEDGYCDVCGCQLDDTPPQLTLDGLAVCEACVVNPPAARHPRHPEARDDGRQLA